MKTIDSERKTKKCVFPFKYGDKIYKDCINNHTSHKGKIVCAVDTKVKISMVSA